MRGHSHLPFGDGSQGESPTYQLFPQDVTQPHRVWPADGQSALYQASCFQKTRLAVMPVRWVGTGPLSHYFPLK